MRQVRRQGSIVVVTPGATITDGSIEAVLAALRAEQRRLEPYAVVFDLTDAAVPTALQRKRLADHMKTTRDAIVRVVRGLAVVAPSSLLRGAITALFWVAPPEVPARTFASFDDALAWAEAQVAASAARV